MPSQRGLRKLVGISSQEELIIMVSFGMVRSAVKWFSFTWNGNVQEIWNLPGPEPSFSMKYHLDYWLKNSQFSAIISIVVILPRLSSRLPSTGRKIIHDLLQRESVTYNQVRFTCTILSLVVLFRNFTTHLHLLFYIVMMFPLLTGEQPRLMLPWLYLQMAKNIVMDAICTSTGVLLCWVLHSCGILALEFFVVQVISMIPSIYLWRRLRSYYFDLYYAELDGDYAFPPMKAGQGTTLAQRRRAAKSLEGTMSMISSPEDRSRGNSCLTYDEVFGPANWEADADVKFSKSLTTLLTIESQESDDVEEENPCLEIIDDENLTPAEKTLKILGLTREEVDATALQMYKKSSTNDLAESQMQSTVDSCIDGKPSFNSVTGKTARIQVQLPDRSDSNDSNRASDLSKKERPGVSKKCECCEETKCSKEEDTDSDEGEAESIETKQDVEDPSSEGKPLDCCDKNREEIAKRQRIRIGEKKRDGDNVGYANAQKTNERSGTDSKTVPTASSYPKNNSLYPGSCLRAVVERDGIAWENLKEINFVSVINQALCNGTRPFKLQRVNENQEKIVEPIPESIPEDHGEKSKCQSEQDIREIIPEHEDGTKFIKKSEESLDSNPTRISVPTSASFGIESDILAANTSYVFERMPISGTQSFDSTIGPVKQPIRPDDNSELRSYFRSSFQRHSNMFDDTRAQLEPLDALQSRVHSSNYRVMHGVNEDSQSYQTDRNSPREKADGSSYSLGFYRSRSSTPQYRKDNYNGWDYSQGNFSGNDIDVVRDIPEDTKSKESENRQSISDPKVHCSSLEVIQQSLYPGPEILAKENSDLTRASQTSSVMFEGDDSKSNSEAMINSQERDGSTTTFIVMDESVTGEKSTHSKSSCQEGSKERRSLASLSRMSRTSKSQETQEERETKEMQALRAYNEKTLFKYKREMDARNQQDQSRESLAEKSPACKYRNGSNQPFYVPSVPELEKPERELISNIEKAYARFTRSKPVDPVNGEAMHGNFVSKEFFDNYNGNGRLKKDSRKTKAGDKGGMRKQHSKYSRFYTEGTKDSDVTSGSCKRIEGLQKGRELDRTLGKENIRAENVEVFFLERQTDEESSTGSKNLFVTTIKSFAPKKDADNLATVSSDFLTSGATRSQMVRVLNNSDEIPCRIEDSKFYRQLRKNNVPRNVKEAVQNIDWSFQWPNFIGISDRSEENSADNAPGGMMGIEMNSDGQDTVHKTTENMLHCIFANGENSARGFRLGESANEFYPIFNRVSIAIEEIVRAAGLRGYTDEFISQPATEIEVPEIVDGNLYGLTNQRRRSPSGFLRCCILTEDNKTVANRTENDESFSINKFTAPDLRQKRLEAVSREADLPDQNETSSIEDEEAPSLLGELISSVEPGSAEINIPVIRAEDVPEEPEDISGDSSSPETKDLEDCPPVLLKIEKSLIPSRGYSAENSLQNWQKPGGISPEKVKLALHHVMLQSPKKKILDTDESDFQFDVASFQGISDRFDAGGRELQSIVFEFFNQFPNCKGLPIRSLKGSEFISGLQMRTDLYTIETKLGEIMKATEYRGAFEEISSSGSGNSSTGENDRARTSVTTNSTSVTSNESMGDDRDKKENNLGPGVVVESNSNPISKASSSEKIGTLHDDHRKLLPNGSSEAQSGSLPNSEMSNRENFRREMISSAFVNAMNQSSSSSDAVENKIDADASAPHRVENELLTPSYEGLNELEESEVEVPEFWVTDDDAEKTTSQSSLSCPTNNIFLLNDGNATPDTVLRDIETAESAIKRMKTIFEQFFTEGRNRQEKLEENETSSDSKSRIAYLTNLRFPLNCELRKLQGLVQTVTNYVAITECSASAHSFKSSIEAVEFGVQMKELEERPEIPQKNEVKSNTDDSQVAEASVPTMRSSAKNSEGPVPSRHQIGSFSSWDKVVPLSTRRQIAKHNRKTKPKKIMAVREPPRRVVKVVKLIGKKNSDFFGARSVPQKGRGLSSGYLMDSDSDGNFTVSRPPTPVSIDSETSRTFSCADKQPDVFPNPLEASGIFPMADTSHSRAIDRPIETCWSSSSANPIKEAFLSTKNSAKDNNDDSKSLQMQDSLEISRSLLMNNAEASSMKESIQAKIIDGDRNASFGTESLSTESDLQYMTPVDAAGIENKLKDVVQLILDHQFSGVNPSTNGLRIGSKNPSLISISDPTGNVFSADSHSNNYNRDQDAEEQQGNCPKRIQELLSKDNDIPIEQLDPHYKPLDSMSRNQDEKLGPPELHTTSYDSFTSTFSHNTTQFSGPLRRAVSISNHTYFEEFPEHVDSRLQFSPNVQGAGSIVPSGSMKSRFKEDLDQKMFKKETSLENLDKTVHQVAPAASSGGKSNEKSKRDANPTKTGIPRPVRGNKERK